MLTGQPHQTTVEASDQLQGGRGVSAATLPASLSAPVPSWRGPAILVILSRSECGIKAH